MNDRAPGYLAHVPGEPAPLDSENWTRFLAPFEEAFPDLRIEVKYILSEGPGWGPAIGSVELFCVAQLLRGTLYTGVPRSDILGTSPVNRVSEKVATASSTQATTRIRYLSGAPMREPCHAWR